MDWPILWPGGSAPDGATPENIALSEKFAANTLRLLTLYRVGGTPITVMPNGRTCTSPVFKRDMFLPALWYPSASALKVCNCILGCSCSSIRGVELTGPVGRIDEVKIGGEVLDPSKYHVEDGTKLIRTDGKGWPACAGPDFTVTYLNSYEVDEMGKYVAGVLALEFFNAITSAKKCRLPSSVTSVARQGISYEVARGMFTEGVTGIPEVDAYIVLWNPHGLRTAPAVYSIDRPAPRIVSWRA